MSIDPKIYEALSKVLKKKKQSETLIKYIEKLLKSWDGGEEFSIKEDISKIVEEVNVPRD
jgi:hypothetical protein|tara:strand:+ start:2115 stop:2294 length:180 start_codon:yes stop_codon:yes gene_type:complete